MGRTACTEPQCLYKGALYLFIFVADASSCKLKGEYGKDNKGCVLFMELLLSQDTNILFVNNEITQINITVVLKLKRRYL